jgi:galactose mutarotase-like enzyme
VSEIDLDCGPAHAKIALAGAEARSWRVAGRDLLWPGDPAIWAEISPVLYPVVDWTRDGVRVGGRRYALGLHGFSRFETFAVETARADFVRFVLRDNERTRAVYPFAFSLAVEYRLSERALGMAFESPIRAASPPPTPVACIQASAGR